MMRSFAATALVLLVTAPAVPALAQPAPEITVTPDPEADWTEENPGLRRADAEMVFHLDRGLTVGYRGFLDCAV